MDDQVQVQAEEQHAVAAAGGRDGTPAPVTTAQERARTRVRPIAVREAGVAVREADVTAREIALVNARTRLAERERLVTTREAAVTDLEAQRARVETFLGNAFLDVRALGPNQADRDASALVRCGRWLRRVGYKIAHMSAWQVIGVLFVIQFIVLSTLAFVELDEANPSSEESEHTWRLIRFAEILAVLVVGLCFAFGMNKCFKTDRNEEAARRGAAMTQGTGGN